jgi:PKD repeat protein
MGTLLLAAMLVLTVLAPPQAGSGVLDAQKSICFTVYRSSRPDVPLENAAVTFTDAHSGDATLLRTDSAGLVHFYPERASYYSILINATGFYDYRYLNADNRTEYIRFDGLSDVLLRSVYLAKLGSPLVPVDVDLDGLTGPDGVAVRIAYMDGVEQTAYEAVLFSGTRVMLPMGSYLIQYGGRGLQPDAFRFQVSAPMTVNVTTRAATKFNVDITTLGLPSSSTVAYLVSKEKAELPRMVISPYQRMGDRMSFDAYPGEFYLLADSANGEARTMNVTLPSETMAVDLAPRRGTVTHQSVDINGGDWNLLQIATVNTVPGERSEVMLQLSQLPSIRMQLDLSPTVGGNANGVVDPQEVSNYTSIMKQVGPDNVTTDSLFTIDGTAFLSDADYRTYAMRTDSLEGSSVSSQDEYSTNLTLGYRSLGAVQNGKSSYLGILNPAYNTTWQGWTYHVEVPRAYVLLGASVVRDPVTILESGYQSIDVASPSYRPGDRRPALLSLPLVTAKEPSASASVVLSPYTYRVDQNTYIVRSGGVIALSAQGSFDPNGNPLTYTWDFGDGGQETTTSVQVAHAYQQPSLSMHATLTVRDVSMLTANATLVLKVDGVYPVNVAAINGSKAGHIVYLDQMQVAQFSAAGSYDRIYDEIEPQGIAKRFDWDFGDGAYANDSMVATHAYMDPGDFTAALAVTDAAGHVSVLPISIHVNDTVGPNVVVDIYRWSDMTPITGSAVKGEVLLFDGSRSTDPSGIASYSWEFGDGANASGMTALHAYASAGTVTGRLTCVDGAGNSAHRPFTLTILPAPEPHMSISEMVFQPSTFTEGVGGSVTVTIVNSGSAVARNITTSFYLVQDSRMLLAQVRNVTVNGQATDRLGIGQSGQVQATFALASKGSYTILANVTAEGETNPHENEKSATLQVAEAPMKNLPIYLAIVVLVAIGLVAAFVRLTRKKEVRKKGKKK